MGLIDKLKELNEEVSFSILGSYHLEFHKLRHLRISIFSLIILIFVINLYMFKPSVILELNQKIHLLLLIILFGIFIIFMSIKLYKKRIFKIKNKKEHSPEDSKKLFSLLANFLTFTSIISLLVVTIIIFTMMIVLLFFIHITIKEILVFYLNNQFLKYIFLFVSFLTIYFLLSYLFRNERKERGFIKRDSDLAISWLKLKFYKTSYLTIMILSTIIEFGMLYPMFFTRDEEIYTGCVKGRVSLVKAQRYLNQKGYNFQKHSFDVSNPLYISLFNNVGSITFHGDFNSKTEIINFGDYCIISNEDSQEHIMVLEEILQKRGILKNVNQ